MENSCLNCKYNFQSTFGYNCLLEVRKQTFNYNTMENLYVMARTTCEDWESGVGVLEKK